MNRPTLLARIARWCVVLLLLAAATALRAAEDGVFFRSLGTPPPGFEDLSGTQSTQADIYFNGELLLSAFVEYDLETITIVDPQPIVDAIPTLLEPQRIRDALTGPRPTNSQHRCHSRAAADCGQLAPETVDLIFDEARFRVDLFVHPDLLRVQTVEQQRYLPEPEAGLALLHDLNFNASGQDGNDRFSFASQSYLAQGVGRLQARYGLTNEGFNLYELSAQWDQRDRQTELGGFRTTGSSTGFINEVNVLGLRVASSTRTRRDLDSALGSPLLVFLNRRSRVDLLRDGELLDSRFYDAGNQQLDTSRLPDGAYELTVRTVDIDGRESVSSQFFVRSNQIPPMGEPQAYFEAGMLSDLGGPRFGATAEGKWFRLGGSRRVRESLALDAELLQASGTEYLTAGGHWFLPGWQLQVGLMRSNEGDVGYLLRANAQLGGLNWLFDYRQVDSADSTLNGAGNGILNGAYAQGSSTLSFPLGRGQGFLRARYTKRAALPADTGIGFSYLGPLFQRRQIAADLTFDSNIGSDDAWVRVGLNFRFRQGGHNLAAAPQLQSVSRDGAAQDVNMLLDARWTHTEYSERFGDLQRGAYALSERGRTIVGTRMASRTRYGYADLDLAHEEGDVRSGLSYSVNGRFSLVTEHGRTALGGGNGQRAAVVVEIDGHELDTEFQVLVNDRVAGYARPGKRSVISLRPYESYAVRIQPLGNQIYNYDETPYTLTLYPGNVQHLTFAAHEITVLVGRAVFADGRPVAGGRIESEEGYGATNGDGWFQVEVSSFDPLPVQYGVDQYCTLKLPPVTAEDGLVVLGDLPCQRLPGRTDPGATPAPR